LEAPGFNRADSRNFLDWAFSVFDDFAILRVSPPGPVVGRNVPRGIILVNPFRMNGLQIASGTRLANREEPGSLTPLQPQLEVLRNRQ
jgi:hypothetical protein